MIFLQKPLEISGISRNFATDRIGGALGFLLIYYMKSSFWNNMIDKKRITELAEEWLKDKDYFLVDTEVDKNNKITVEIDHKEGVWIEDCCELSRFINEQCQPEIDDYELEVGSAGIGQPFKVLQQYINNIGYEVELLTAAGKKQHGVLTAADEQGFTVEVEEKQKIEGKKRPQMVAVEYTYTLADVKWVKAVIDFK